MDIILSYAVATIYVAVFVFILGALIWQTFND